MDQPHYEDQVAEAIRQVKECCGDSLTRLAKRVSIKNCRFCEMTNLD
ncbi:hypothetical protein [Desulfosporosinus sp.]|nr:hypothetical protein [Desulfosporosinus sp.]